jgi:hypothetical protein
MSSVDTATDIGGVHAVRNVGTGAPRKLAASVLEKGRPFLVVVE